MLGFYSSSYFQKILLGSRRSAEVVVPLVLDLTEAKSVVDVGCGSGAWLETFSKLGVMKILGIDKNISKDDLLISDKSFINADLTKPFPVSEKFDLAICLEVGEHLPPDSAGQLVESLVKLAPIVLFSAAQPFQGGHKHLNEQWPEYWVDLFCRHNYVVVDPLRKKIWSDPDVEWWYAQNLLLFVKQDTISQYPKLENERKLTFEKQLSLVHPRSLTIKKVLKAFPVLFIRAIKKRL